MWFTPRVLSLITTHQCTAACAHCCFSCSPAQGKAIPVPRLHGLVEEAAELRSIRLVVFTGGECFLLGRNLDDLLSRCAGLGLATRCVTNGYWAVSEPAAEARVRDLKAAGLGEINFSTGPFHARYVPVERVRHGALAAAAQGLQVAVNVEVFEGAEYPEDRLTGDPAFRAQVAAGRILLLKGSWIPNGGEILDAACAGCSSTAGLSHPEPHRRFRPGGRRGPCSSSLATVAVNPDQHLITCCGLTLEYIPGLHVASVRDRTLREALEGVQPDLLKMWIHTEGPEAILEFVQARDPSFELPLDSAHPCHTCAFLHRSPQAMAVLRDCAGEVEGRVLERYVLACAAQELASLQPALRT